MKNLVLIFTVAILISFNASAQNPKDLPAKAKISFDQKFPDAQKVKWSKENTTEWEAEFKMETKDYSANFNAEGLWLETEYGISVKEIPTAVTKTLTKEFPGYKIVESEVSETYKGKVYEFALKTGSKKQEVALDENGALQK